MQTQVGGCRGGGRGRGGGVEQGGESDGSYLHRCRPRWGGVGGVGEEGGGG